MDYRQDIGFAGAATTAQAFGSFAPARSDVVTQAAAVTPVAATTASSEPTYEQNSQWDGVINPQTILDPDLHVNVAQFSFNEGTIEFQVPSRNQIETYRMAQDVGDEQADKDTQRFVTRTTAEREATDADGVGDSTQQAVGTVGAAIVSQTMPAQGTTAPSGQSGRGEDTTTPRPGMGARHQIELEA